jgi:uncharacterized membrane protein
MHTFKKYFIFFIGPAYILAGLNHFIHEAFYTKMIADFLPYPVQIVFISGVAEMLCGLGLLIPSTRKAAAWGTIALLIAIFPANIYMAMHPDKFGFPAKDLYLRLPIQLVLIWLAWIYTKD